MINYIKIGVSTTLKPLPIYVNLSGQPNKKINHYISLGKIKHNKNLFIFDHGLGDIVEFLSLYETFKAKYPNKTIHIGTHPTLGFKGLHKDIIDMNKYLSPSFVMPIGKSIVQDKNAAKRYDLFKLLKEYDHIFVIQYFDYCHPTHPIMKVANPKNKNEMCKVLEFGLNELEEIKDYKILTNLNNKDSKKIVFHSNGHTDKLLKTPDLKTQELIWKEVEELGLEPIDVHQNNMVQIPSSKQDAPSFISNNIRDNSSDYLSTLLNIVSESIGCIGILSGPLHLCNNILGPDKCIGLQVEFEINKYVGKGNLSTVDCKNYVPGSVKKLIETQILGK